MNLSVTPINGNGFVYILSNPAFEGTHKIGLTTRSLAERLRELNNTSVPEDFKLEKAFEIQEKHLRDVESRAHQILRRKEKHYRKEYFLASLEECVEAVQDAIYHVSGSYAQELVGKAKERAAEAERLAAIRRRNEERRLSILQSENAQIDQRRKLLIEELRKDNPGRKWGWFILTVIILVLYSYSISTRKVYDADQDATSGLYLFLGIIGAFSFLRVDEKKVVEKAAEKLPYKTLSEIPEITEPNDQPINIKPAQNIPNEQGTILLCQSCGKKNRVISSGKIGIFKCKACGSILCKDAFENQKKKEPVGNSSGQFSAYMNNNRSNEKSPAINRPAINRNDAYAGQFINHPSPHPIVHPATSFNNTDYISASVKWCDRCDYRLDTSLGNSVTCKKCGKEFQ